jgi:hypothetical protein
MAGLLRVGWAVYLLVVGITSTTDFHSEQNPFERVALIRLDTNGKTSGRLSWL